MVETTNVRENTAAVTTLASEAGSAPAGTELTEQTLAGLRASFVADPARVVAQNAVARTDIDEVAVNHARLVEVRRAMSSKLDEWAVTNQKKSGRCWLFAALNLLRFDARKQLGLKEFEFSQAYAMYWDKLERSNFFLQQIVQTAAEPLDGRVVQFLLGDPLGDGGQWAMACSIFAKHGVVPKDVMPETQSSSASAHMNARMCTLLRRAALQIRDAAASGADAAAVQELVSKAVAEAHTILTTHLGTPPEKFTWEWTDTDGQFHREADITPVDFLVRFVGLDLDDLVCLVDDPRPEHAKGSLLTVEHLGNVVGGRPVRYLNTPIDTIKKIAADTIVGGEPVWFGCDVAKQFLRTDGVWASDLLSYDAVYGVDLGLTKEQRVRSGESAMTHAMLLVGVDQDGDQPKRWRVENSWGDTNGDKGFFTMDDSWFDQYVFEVVVHKSALPADLRAALDSKDVTVLPAWDPMGSLA